MRMTTSMLLVQAHHNVFMTDLGISPQNNRFCSQILQKGIYSFDSLCLLDYRYIQ
jgi:hypothetical protein